MDANKFFGDVSKIPIVGEFIIGCAIYFVLSLVYATTEGFGLDEKHQSSFQYLFLAIAIAYFTVGLSLRAWKYLKRKQEENTEF